MSPPGELAMFLAIGAAALGILFGPIGSALARRLGGRPDPGEAPAAEVEQLSERITAEVDDLRGRLAEVEERLDFAERLLARRGRAGPDFKGSPQMITREDLQSFFDRLYGGNLSVLELEPNLWLLRTPDGAEVVVHYAPPVVILRVRVMELPESEPRRGELFRQLLEYNARDLVHGSYGLEGDHVVLTDTLELENLDFSEFEASFESMTLALASHLGALASYRER